MGRLQRKLGLTIDSLLAVELVTADGRVVRASEDENPELFWGMRGAGANFGIVTSFEFLLHPFEGQVTHGTVTPSDRAGRGAGRAATASSWRTGPTSCGRRSGWRVGAGRSRSGRVRCPCSTAARRRSGARPRRAARARAIRSRTRSSRSSTSSSQRLLRRADGVGAALLDEELASSPRSPTALVRDWADQVSRRPRRSRGWLLGLGVGARDRVRLRGRHRVHGPRRRLLGGRRDRLERRRARRRLPLLGAGRRSTRRRRTRSAGRYVNDVIEVGADVARTIYGDAKYERLVALKREWDPDNVFRLNQNITP